jgi:hypothetical protein
MSTNRSTVNGPGLGSAGDRDLARVLALLGSDHAGSISVLTLREGGVRAPAQAVYDLQLVGYTIDRTSQIDQYGRRTLGYRLRDPEAADR